MVKGLRFPALYYQMGALYLFDLDIWHHVFLQASYTNQGVLASFNFPFEIEEFFMGRLPLAVDQALW